jgi:hypothetical protein
MTSMERYGGSGLAPRDAKQIRRAQNRREVERDGRFGRTDLETDVAISKVQNATMATGVGMQAVVTVATAQQSLEQMAPAASGRLAMIADMHALDIVDTLADLRCRLRRI